MRITRRQLRRIIREAASAPSLESLFIGNARYGLTNWKNWINIEDDIVTLAEEIPGLEQKIRKMLGPSPEGPVPPGWGPRDFDEFFGTHVRVVTKKATPPKEYDEDGMLIHASVNVMTQEWAEFGLDLIRQAGIEEEILNLNRSLEEAEKERLAKEEAEKEAAELLGPQVPIDTNTGTDLTVDAMGADDAVDSVSGDATDPVFLRQLAGWLKKMDKNPAVQMIMFNMD